MTCIFDAARKGDVETVLECLNAGADPGACNEYGFTALHSAAMGANSADNDRIIEVMKLLLEAGCLIEAIGGGRRTALFLAAEFSRSVEPVRFLLGAGASPHVTDEGGNSIVENAMLGEVKSLLSGITGIPIPPPPLPTPDPVRLPAKQWREVKERIDVVYESLSANGLVALHDAGSTQDDGFSDCSEESRNRGGYNAGVRGFCYYTRQDLNRAKRTSQLSLAFWGAPDGAHDDMNRVGKLIVDTFQKAGFAIEWSGSSSERPILHLAEMTIGTPTIPF